MAAIETLIVNEAGIGQVLDLLDRELKGQSFVLWLKGEMGAGKTTLVRHLLRHWGLPEDTPVVSPTYTIMNEYQIGSQWFAHLDLYRAEEGFSLDEIGVKDVKEYQGIFMEWPDNPGKDETISPTHLLEITYENDGLSRGYCLAPVR